jgi:small-conductance mechanosensitive channel/CRP-like cAMP-binding protein
VKTRTRIFIPLLVGAVLFAIHTLLVARSDIEPKLLNILLFAAAVPLILFAVRAIDALAFGVLSRKKQVNAPMLLREMFAIVLYIALFGWAISTIFNYAVTGLLFTGTVVAAVLGLALQETLGNIFAGIALHLEDSYEVGDVIRSGEFIGVVEAVRWRATRIRTFNNDMVLLPNSVLARERLEVFPRTNLNARILQIGIDTNVPPATVIRVLTQAAANVEGVAREIPILARVAGFAASAVTYDIKYFMRDYSQRDRIDAEIRKAAWYALRRNAIPIPFPVSEFRTYVAPNEHLQLTRDELVEQLLQVDILSPLTPDARMQIAAAARVDSYSRGETIIRRGEEGSSMFIVHDGSVAIRVDGKEVTRLGPGSVVGEMALLTGETRTADVVAVTDVIAAEIDKSALEPILRQHPDLAHAISAKVISRQISLDALDDTAPGIAEHTVLSRIRDYFGL